MRRVRRRRVATTLIKAPICAQRRVVSQIYSPPLVVRIVPGPPMTSPLVYARTWCEWIGQRQWLVAPTLELLD